MVGDPSLEKRVSGIPATQNPQAVKEQIDSSESTAIYSNCGLNNIPNQQLVKNGESGYTPKDMVNQRGVPPTGVN